MLPGRAYSPRLGRAAAAALACFAQSQQPCDDYARKRRVGTVPCSAFVPTRSCRESTHGSTHNSAKRLTRRPGRLRALIPECSRHRAAARCCCDCNIRQRFAPTFTCLRQTSTKVSWQKVESLFSFVFVRRQHRPEGLATICRCMF